MFVCPDGHELRGTVEWVGGIALAEPTLVDGKIEPEYVGETEVDWDSQYTQQIGGEDQWMCENGNYFRASELIEQRDEDEDE